MRAFIASVLGGAALLSGSVATAQTQPQTQPQPQTQQIAQISSAAPAVRDPVICEKQEVTGSRLATRKICMKRSQWQDIRLQQQQTLDKAQIQRGLIPPG